MGYLFDIAPLPDGSRFTQLWEGRRTSMRRSGRTVMAHFVELPADQHVEVEGDFLSSHLPFSLGGVGGVFPNGSGWLLALQQGDDEALDAPHELGVMDHTVQRALELNPGARSTMVLSWDREELSEVYADRGVDALLLDLWRVTDLATGLLAECCGPPLQALAEGFLNGCAFPNVTHTCEHEVFTDVFRRWGDGALRMDG